MSAIFVSSIAKAARTGAVVFAALSGCVWLPAQTATENGSQTELKKPPPTFHAAGIQGNIAPSGYSGGAREEQARQVASLVVELQAVHFADELPTGIKMTCDRQPELLHAALTQPASFAANLRLGLFYLQHESPGLSVKSLELAKDLNPGDNPTQYYLAHAELAANDYASAARLAAQWTDTGRSSAETHRIKGAVAAAEGDGKTALAEYRQSVALDAGVNNVFSAGLAVMSLGLFDDAEQMLTTGTSAHPDSAKLWLARGMNEILEEIQGQAIDSLLRAAELDPADPLAPTLLATQADAGEALARVLPVVRSFAAARPHDAISHYDLALVLSKMKPGATDSIVDEQILAGLKAAIQVQPQFAAAHFQLGVFYQDAGDEKSAIGELSEAVRLDPEVAEWHYRLARAYRRNGQTPAAESEMHSFQALKARRDAGADVSAKLLDGVTLSALGVDSRCPAGIGDASR
jgi:tetratricopeptide (TPR) repeat protein